MGKRHDGAHCKAQLVRKMSRVLIQRVQDRCDLRDVAVTVAGDGNDEVGHRIETVKLLSGYWPFKRLNMLAFLEPRFTRPGRFGDAGMEQRIWSGAEPYHKAVVHIAIANTAGRRHGQASNAISLLYPGHYLL